MKHKGTSAQEIKCGSCRKMFWVEQPNPGPLSCPVCFTTGWAEISRDVVILVSDAKADRVPYEDVKELWNGICVSYPKLVAITDKRKVSLRCRWEQLQELGKFEEAFRKLEASDFCKGKNDRSWKASFDWIIANQTNIVKVLEGKYDNNSISYSKNSQGNFDKMRDLNYLVE